MSFTPFSAKYKKRGYVPMDSGAEGYTPAPVEVQAPSPLDIFKPVVRGVEDFTSGLQRGFNESGVGRFLNTAVERVQEPSNAFFRSLGVPDAGAPGSPEYETARLLKAPRNPNYVPTPQEIEAASVYQNAAIGFGFGNRFGRGGMRGPAPAPRVAPQPLTAPARPLALGPGAIPMRGAIAQPPPRGRFFGAAEDIRTQEPRGTTTVVDRAPAAAVDVTDAAFRRNRGPGVSQDFADWFKAGLARNAASTPPAAPPTPPIRPFSERVGKLTPVGREDLTLTGRGVARGEEPIPPMSIDDLRRRIGSPEGVVDDTWQEGVPLNAEQLSARIGAKNRAQTANSLNNSLNVEARMEAPLTASELSRRIGAPEPRVAATGTLGSSGMSGPLVGRAIGRGSSQLSRAGRKVEGLDATPADLNASLVRQKKVHDANEAAIAAARAGDQAALARARADVELLSGDLKHTDARIRRAGVKVGASRSEVPNRTTDDTVMADMQASIDALKAKAPRKPNYGEPRPARVAVRPHTYRGEEGFSIYGTDGQGRSVKIFAPSRDIAEAIRNDIKVNDGNNIDDLLSGRTSPGGTNAPQAPSTAPRVPDQRGRGGFLKEQGGSTTVEGALGVGLLRRAFRPFSRSGETPGGGGYRLSAANQAARAKLKQATETADQQFDRMVPPTPRAFTPPARPGNVRPDAPLPSDRIPGKPKSSKVEKVLSVVNLPKALKASLDLSAPLRQGAFLALGHPGDFLSASKAMFRALADDAYAARLETEIRSVDRPGLYLRLKDAPLGAKDEAFMSNLLMGDVKVAGKNVNLYAKSQNAFNAFLNKLSADVYDSTLKSWKVGGKPATASEARRLASVINHYVGRGDLPGFVSDDMAAALNGLFFSPRYVISRFQSIGDALGAVKNPSDRVARQAAGDLLKFVGGGLTILALAKANGAKVEDDPRSSKFGKIQVGPTDVDIWAGSQQIARYTAQFILAQRKTATGKNAGQIQDQPRGKTVARFVRSKLSPSASAVESIADFIPDELFGGGGPTAKDKKANETAEFGDRILGRDFIGDPITPKTLPVDLAAPLGWENAKEALDADEEKARAIVLGLLNLFGVSTTTIDDADVPETPAPAPKPTKTPAPSRTPRPSATPRRTASPTFRPFSGGQP